MDEKILISVIIPIYNGENYLYRCIKSLLDQTYKNFEILLIDDGSIDDSRKICKEFAENKYPRIKYYYKTNGGTSSARNYGIEKAKGNYISFMDQDDYVDKNHIKNFINNLGDYDWIMQGLINVTEDNKIIKSYQLNHQIECRKKNEVDKYLREVVAFDWVNNKLYKKDIILQNNIVFFTPKIINEDRVFNINYSLYIEKFLMISGGTYYWVENFNSQTHRYIHPEIFYREGCAYDDFICKQNIKIYLSKYSSKHAVRCFIHCIGLCILSKKNRVKRGERLKLFKNTILKMISSNSLKKYPFFMLEQVFINIIVYIVKFIKYRKQKKFDLL